MHDHDVRNALGSADDLTRYEGIVLEFVAQHHGSIT
jgi:hypothetical protein